MTTEKKALMALMRLNDDPRNASLTRAIGLYIVELQDQVAILQKAIHSRSREDNFQKAGDLIEARIDEVILSTYTTI